MIRIDSLFDISYGNSLELNRLSQHVSGINFVSRTAKNNGVSAKVIKISNVEPLESGLITVAYGGSVLETFLQPQPFYTGFHIGILKPNVSLTNSEKLYYCACIRANKYRYNYGRQANRTLKDIFIPDISEIPAWVHQADVEMYEGAENPAIPDMVLSIAPLSWQAVKISSLFTVKKGKRLTKADMTSGEVPFIGAIDSNNGITAFIGQKAIHKANTITVNYNGNGVAEAFYQPAPFWATDDVNVLYPKFDLTPAIALFIATLIRQEKFRFNYGRKWHMERMNNSYIRLPVKADKTLDWSFMESYIKSLPYSSQI